jgi:biopolymer transport protein ExbB
MTQSNLRPPFFARASKASSRLLPAYVLLALGACYLFPGGDLLAQGADDEIIQKNQLQKVIQAMNWWLIPFILVSVVMVALAIFNLIQLTASKFVPKPLEAALMDHMQACRVRSAIEVASTSPTFLGRMMTTVLPAVDATDPETLGKDAVEDKMAEFTVKETRPYMNWVGYLSVLAQISPMLGLMGTVSGMIKAFDAMGGGESPSPSALAVNISEALYTTFGGLLVALPSIFLYYFFRNRLNKLVGDAHDSAQAMMEAAITAVNADQQLAKVPEGLHGDEAMDVIPA